METEALFQNLASHLPKQQFKAGMLLIRELVQGLGGIIILASKIVDKC